MKDDKRYAAGMKVRRAVLGDKWVNRATAARTTFDEEWQAHITQFAWGEVWTRPGIRREIRSYMTLALMIATCSPERSLKGAPGELGAVK